MADWTSSREGFREQVLSSSFTSTSKKGFRICLGMLRRPQMRSFIWLREYLVACSKA
jgi:hypothetical protein